MSSAGIPIAPASFPWYPIPPDFTFSLGIAVDGHAYNSGHSGSVLDPVKGKPDVPGGLGEQAAVAYAKQAAVLAGAGLALSDVTRVVENVTVEGLAHYPEAEQAREEAFGAHRPAVVTVVVDRLVRRKALIEVEVHASPGGGAAYSAGPDAGWRRSTAVEGHDGAVYLPTLLPVDSGGAVVADGDIVSQYAFCLDRAAELLASAGLTPANVVSTIDYSTKDTRDSYPKIARARRDRLGPVYPAAAGVLMSRLHAPGILVAVDVIASRHAPVAINPGWSRYETLTYNPGVRAGDTLYMSGFASLDMQTQRAKHAGDLRRQAESVYQAIFEVMVAAGQAQLLSTTEYVTPEALPAYRAVADVRRELLTDPYPVSAGLVCAGLLRPEFMLEVVPSALVTGEAGEP